MRLPRTSVNTILFALTTVAMGVFFIGMPRYVDDFWYSTYIKSWHDGLQYTHWWQPVIDTIKYHVTFDTARLSNIVYAPFLLLPKWVGSLPIALLTFPTLMLMMRLASVSWRRSPLGAVLVLLFGFGLPWYDSIGSECYQFNYVVPMALGLWIAAAALRLIKSPRWLLVSGGIILGMWHEGFAIPVACGLTAAAVMCPRGTDRRTLIIAVAAIGTGLLWIVLSPSLENRMGQVNIQYRRPPLKLITFILMQRPLFLVTCAMLVIAAIRRASRRLLYTSAVIFLVVSALASLTICYFTIAASRAAWWTDTATLPLCLILLRLFFPRITETYTRSSLLCAAPCVALAAAHYAAVDYYSLKADRAMRRITEEHLANPDKAVFTDFPDELHAPIICFQMPDFTIFTGEFSRKTFDWYHHSYDEHHLRIVPQALRLMTADSGTEVPGGTGIRMVDGHLVIPCELCPDDIHTHDIYDGYTLTIDFGHRVREGTKVIHTVFTSEADGRCYVYLYPWRCVPDIWLGEIKSITNLRPFSSCS